MSKIIRAVVLDGFHAGHVVAMEYQEILKLPRPKTVRVDYCCDGSEHPISDEGIEEYRVAFHGVGKDVVLYCKSGKSLDFLSMSYWQQTNKPWSKRTTLYFGYHNEPIMREDGNEKRTES